MTDPKTLFALRQPKAVSSNCLRRSWPATGLPGISCWGEPGSCGRVWSALDERIRLPIGEDYFLRNRPLDPVVPPEFETIAKEVINTLNLPEDMTLRPGTSIGYLEVDQLKLCDTSFIWLPVSTIVVTDEVRQFVIDNQFTGLQFDPVVVRQRAKGVSQTTLWECVLDGRGTVSTEPSATEDSCSVCGWRGYDWSKLSRVVVEETGAYDFLTFPPPLAGIVFVTADVAKKLSTSGLTNFTLVPITDVIHDVIAKIKRL